MSEVQEIAGKLSPAQRRALRALPSVPGVWATVSEMRPYGSTGANSDVLYINHRQKPLCERRWATWGGERGQKRGEGYEYRSTALGLQVRAHLQATQAE